MTLNRQARILQSRRRRDEDGEEEDSTVGEVEEGSLSEGSVISNGDDDAEIEGSEVTEDDVNNLQPEKNPVKTSLFSTRPDPQDRNRPTESTIFKASSDTEVLLNGLQIADIDDNAEEIEHCEMFAKSPDLNATGSQTQPGASKHETLTGRGRKEQQEYLKQSHENPTFVPNRGGFFLHDDRTNFKVSGGFRPFMHGRGRGRYNGVPAR